MPSGVFPAVGFFLEEDCQRDFRAVHGTGPRRRLPAGCTLERPVAGELHQAGITQENTIDCTYVLGENDFGTIQGFTATKLLGEEPVMIKNVINGKLHVNYVFKAGAIYSWDRLSVGVSGSYDSYNYRGTTDVPAEYSGEGVDFDKIHSTGRFSRWSASLKLSVKF